MNPGKRFLEYAAAFEETYEDDDWNRLGPFFSRDAVYTANGEAPFGGRAEGREAVLERLRESVDELDRRFDVRRVELLGKPKVEENRFEMSWRATYEKAGCPDLVLDGFERATFEGDEISLLEDVFEEGADREIQAYMAKHLSGDAGEA